jgi:hypothetical protein
MGILYKKSWWKKSSLNRDNFSLTPYFYYSKVFQILYSTQYNPTESSMVSKQNLSKNWMYWVEKLKSLYIQRKENK